MSYQQYTLLLLLTLAPSLYASNADTTKALKRIGLLCGHLKSSSPSAPIATLPTIPSEWQRSDLAKWEPAGLKELAGWARSKKQNSNTDHIQSETAHKKS